MTAPSPAMRDLARRLLAATRAARSVTTPGKDGAASLHETVAVCETLRIAVTKFAGPDGFAALVRRALAGARTEAPLLQGVRLGDDGQLKGFEDLPSGREGADAAVALAAHLLTLLVVFIGEPLTLQFLQDSWPGARLKK
jgi:hypothetical protein